MKTEQAMSDIVEARRLIAEAQLKRAEAMALQREADAMTARAVKMMVRKSPVRRANARRVFITDDMEQSIHAMAKDPRLTMHDIGIKVGLRNGGRVSEVLTGKR
jgi:ribosomal protein L13